MSVPFFAGHKLIRDSIEKMCEKSVRLVVCPGHESYVLKIRYGRRGPGAQGCD